MFVVIRQAEAVFAGIPEISRWQMVVERHDERDRFTLNLELQKGADASLVTVTLAQKFQDACRVRADDIVVLAPGSIAENAALIDDRRVWE
jgi:hypothetical protein